MNTCGTCKHFGPSVPELMDLEEFGESPYHVCQLLKHLNGGCRPYPTTDPAGVIDMSGANATFCVKEEFGCNQWAEREN